MQIWWELLLFLDSTFKSAPFLGFCIFKVSTFLSEKCCVLFVTKHQLESIFFWMMSDNYIQFNIIKCCMCVFVCPSVWLLSHFCYLFVGFAYTVFFLFLFHRVGNRASNVCRSQLCYVCECIPSQRGLGR